MPISTILTMFCLSGFELYSRWVPLKSGNGCGRFNETKAHRITTHRYM